ncbi:DMT family transporter [Vibrio sp. TRT 17S01]|uniref:DMT family transporter n=1 Tax=Vibrio sp. TRT 17S01 TaxID=3418505 RepID=UPI003CEF6558
MNILLAMIPAFFWGSTYAVTKFTLPDWPPILLGALRALPAGLLLLMLKPTLPKKSELKILFVLGAVNIALFFSLIFVMAMTLPSAVSGVGMVSVPVFAMLFHWLYSKQTPNLIQGLSGLALIALAYTLFNPASMTLSVFGLIAMLAAIMCIIVGSTITKSLGSKLHWWKVLTWQLIFGGAILACVSTVQAFISPEQYINTWHSFNQVNALGLGWVIILNTVLGYGLYVWLLQRMSVVDFTFGGIANPIAGIVFGLVLLNESYNSHQYALMLAMILMSLTPQLIAVIKMRKTTTA